MKRVYAYDSTIIVNRDVSVGMLYGRNITLFSYGSIDNIYVDGGRFIYIRGKPYRLKGVIRNVDDVLIGMEIDNNTLSIKEHLIEALFPSLKIENVNYTSLRITSRKYLQVKDFHDDRVVLVLTDGGEVINSNLRGLVIDFGKNVILENIEVNYLDVFSSSYNGTVSIKNVKTYNIVLDNVTCKVIFHWNNLELYVGESGPYGIAFRDPYSMILDLYYSKCHFSGDAYHYFHIYAEKSYIMFDANPQVVQFVENRWMYFHKTVVMFTLRNNTRAVIPWDFVENVDADNSSIVTYYVKNVQIYGEAKPICDGQILNSTFIERCNSLSVIDGKGVVTQIRCSGCKYYTIDWVVEKIKNIILQMGIFGVSMLLALFSFYTLQHKDIEAMKTLTNSEKILLLSETLLIAFMLLNEPWLASLLYSIFNVWPGMSLMHAIIAIPLFVMLALYVRKKQLEESTLLSGILAINFITVYFITLKLGTLTAFTMIILYTIIIVYFLKYSVVRHHLTHKRLVSFMFYGAILFVALLTARRIIEPRVLVDSLTYTCYNQKHIEYLTPDNPLPYIMTFLLFWFAGLFLANRFKIKWTYLTYISIGAICTLIYHLLDMPFYSDQFVEHWDSIGVAEKMVYEPSYMVTLASVFLGPHIPTIRFYTLIVFLLLKKYYFLRVFTLGTTLLILTVILKLVREISDEETVNSFAMLLSLSPVFFGLMTLGQTADRGFWFLLLGLLLLMTGRRILALAAFLASHFMYLITMSVALPTTFLHALFHHPSNRKEIGALIGYYTITTTLIIFLLPYARGFYSDFLPAGLGINIWYMIKTLAYAIIAGLYAIITLPLLALPQIFSFLTYSIDVVQLPTLMIEGFSQIVYPSFPVPSFASIMVFVTFILSMFHTLMCMRKTLWLWIGLILSAILQLYALSLTVPLFPVCCWVYIDYFVLTRLMPLVIFSIFLIAFGRRTKLLSILFLLLFLSMGTFTILTASSIETPIFQLSSYGASHILLRENAVVTHYHIRDDRVESLLYSLDDEISPSGVGKMSVFEAIKIGKVRLDQKVCAFIPRGEYTLVDELPPEYRSIFGVDIQNIIPYGHSRYFVSKYENLHGKVKVLLEAEKDGIEQLIIVCYRLEDLLRALSWIE